jgi:hypothetical protein
MCPVRSVTYVSGRSTCEPDFLDQCGTLAIEDTGKVKAWADALIGPTSLPGKYSELMNPPGSETGPGQIVTWGKSTVCSVDAFGFQSPWTTCLPRCVHRRFRADSRPGHQQHCL